MVCKIEPDCRCATVADANRCANWVGETVKKHPLLLLQERQKTHGDFMQNAAISQGLKCTLQSVTGWTVLDPVHREALDLICTKIGRIMAGQADFKDHWDDIAGYAHLAAGQCQQ